MSLKYTNMNKLLFKEGGQPFYLDDLEFMQSAFAETVKGIISTYGNVILSGCNIPPPISIAGHPTTYDWEEGYIAINGEVYRVEKGRFQGGLNSELYWKVVSTDEQKENYEDASEGCVYRIRKVVLTDTVKEGELFVSQQTMKTLEELTSRSLSLSVEEVSVNADGNKATIRVSEEDIPLLQEGDMIEIIISLGFKYGIMDGAVTSVESFKFIVSNDSRSYRCIVAKSDTGETIIPVYANFNAGTGALYLSHDTNRVLYVSPKSNHRIVVHKNIQK